MLRLKYIFPAAIAILFFTTFFSCKKVIQVNLKNTSPLIVITGEVNNLPGPYTVTISRSVNYTANNTFPPVTGGLVIISGNGTVDTLTETAAGVYTSHTLQGVPGGSYSLYVSVEGQVYTASSVMPSPVTLDSIGVTTRINGDKLNGVVHFQDPTGVHNYYQFIEYNNGVPFANSRGWSVFDDRLSDGRYINNTLFDDSTDIRRGDNFTVKMNCIDKGVYDYLFTLFLIANTNNFNAPSPANPISNISNNALGYFTAQTTQSKTIVVP